MQYVWDSKIISHVNRVDCTHMHAVPDNLTKLNRKKTVFFFKLHEIRTVAV